MSLAAGPVRTPYAGATLHIIGNPASATGQTWRFVASFLHWFHVLAWGPEGPIRAAMDGDADSPDETLSFMPSLSDLAAGIAVWEGSTRIRLQDGSHVPAQTRFRLQATDFNGEPMPLLAAESPEAAALGLPAAPGALIVVLAPFRAHVTFEASTPAVFGGAWAPLLSVYSAFPTAAPPGDIRTEFEGGFWYICAAGHYDFGSGCRPAPAGSYVDSPGAQAYIPCPPGTYQPSPASTSCIPASPGHYASGSGNTAQQPCSPGHYQSEPSSSACVAAPLGFYVPEAGALSPTACPAGTTTYAVGSVACVPENTAPRIIAITGPAPIAAQASAVIRVEFADADAGDSHSAEIQWGDGTTSFAADVIPGFAINHQYASPGVFEVNVRVIDGGGLVDELSYGYVVVYDADAGFVAGSGWVLYDTGACEDLCSGEGLAGFGFVASYQKGRNTPYGSTRFHFQSGSLSFESSDYESLSVAASRAQLRGSGAINGVPGYSFLITASDGQMQKNRNEPDRFRIRIWETVSKRVVFDNQPGAGDDPAAGTPLDGSRGSGDIIIKAK